MQINDFDNMLTCTSKFSTKFTEIGHGFVVYQITRTQKFSSTLKVGTTREEKSVIEGITKLDSLMAYLNGESDGREQPTVRLYGQDIHVVALHSAILEIMRTEGFQVAVDRLYAEKNPLAVKTPFTAFTEGEDVEFVAFYLSNYMMFRLDGEPLPNALYFGYIDGKVTDRNFDLEKTVKILAERGDIAFKEGTTYSDRKKKIAKPEDHIQSIPGYNSECGRYYLHFFWQPTREDYLRVWGKAMELYPNRMPLSGHLRQAIFELDFFGLRAAGADKREDHYGF